MDTEHDPAEAATPVAPGDDTPAPPGAEETMQAAAERINALETELATTRENWLRSEAEAQNIRNRARRDVDDARQFAVQKFAGDVVEAAENLRRGLGSLPAPAADEDPVVGKLREGFESVERSFVGILERNGIAGTDPTGMPFDANLHQAMAEQPSDTVPAGHVLAAWTRTWTLNGRLLKPAMVVVAKGAAEPAPAPTPGLDTTA
jgi:molecular chaperone GrpE